MSGSSDAIKRFYKTVAVVKRNEGFEIRLDDRPLRTKRRKTVMAPAARLAEAIRGEWEEQEDQIDLASTPLTNLLADAIDANAAPQWRNDILAYLKSDLVCYRADAPQALVDRQAEAWDPYLEWLRDELGSALVITTGVMTTPQPDIAISRVQTILNDAGRETLAALRRATTITGSAVMALALWKKAFPAADIYAASIIDETFQAEQWGADADAAARRNLIEQEFMHIARFLDLLAGD